MLDRLIFEYKMLGQKKKDMIKTILLIAIALFAFLINSQVNAADKDELIRHLRKLKYPDAEIKKIINSMSDKQIKDLIKFINDNKMPTLSEALDLFYLPKTLIKHEINNLIEGYRDFINWIRGIGL